MYLISHISLAYLKRDNTCRTDVKLNHVYLSTVEINGKHTTFKRFKWRGWVNVIFK